MKKFLKILSITVCSLVGLLYLTFLTAPFGINLFFDFDKFKPDIQKIVTENSKLNLDYSKIKVYTTPLLSAGVIINDINVTLPDKSVLFKTSRVKTGIALPSLLTLTVKTALTSVDDPYINLETVNGEQYKIVQIAEQIINENNKKPASEEPAQELPFDINKIKIKVPLIKVKNCEVLVNDIKSGHYITLKSKNLNLGYNGPKNRVRINTLSELYSDMNRNITADIKTVFTLPEFEQSTETADPEETVALPFINIVEIYQKYDLKANVKSRLALIKTKKHGYLAKGYVNVDNVSLKLSDIKLPESWFHAKFKGEHITYDGNIYAKSDEKISLDGFLKYGKHPHLKANIVSDEIHFQNMLDLLTALLDSLNIKNNLDTIAAKGYLLANAVIDTDFKKLKSNGSVVVKDGEFVSKVLNMGIYNLNADLLLDNNSLSIKNTAADIGGAKLKAEGFIDNKSNVDIKINTTNLSIPVLYNIFAPKELKKEFALKTATLNSSINIKGKLEDIKTKLNAAVEGLSLSDTKNTMFLVNNKLKADFDLDNVQIVGKIENDGFIFNIPSMKTKTTIDKIKIDMDNNSITINPFDFVYNSLSKITIKGSIENYAKKPEISMFVDGKISTDNLLETLGKDLAPYFGARGNIPLKISITGNDKKQDIKAQIFNNSANYITPVNLLALKNASSIIQADVNIKGSKIKIKNSGLYKTKGSFSNELDNNLIGSNKLVDFDCVIDNDHVNLLRINIPNELAGNISIFKKSNFKTKGKITLSGKFDNLNYLGNLKVYDLNIPEILFKIKEIDLGLFAQNLNMTLKDIDLNGSKIDTSFKTSLAPAKVVKIDNLNVTSSYIDVDKATEVATKATEILEKIAPPQNSSKPAAQADIPVAADGRFNISKITTGAMVIDSVKGDLKVKNNNLLIDRLSSKAFGGNITGTIKMNLLSTLMDIKVKGNNINADKMLTDAAGMKDTIFGTTSFKTDISLKGATYLEQVKSLKGNVWFQIKNGQYGPFAKLENFFLAENIRENVFFKNTIGAIISPITTIDSTQFENLEGKLNFNNGIASLESISSQGNILCILIKGNMDLIKNEIDSSVRVRLASTVSDALGPLALVNPVNLVKNAPGLNIATAKLFTFFTQVVDESEYKEIPDFSAKHSDKNATKFQIVLKGDVAKPLKLVKSFKWLNVQSEIDEATEFSNKYIKEQEDLAKQALIKKLQEEYEANNKLKVGVEKVLQMDTTAPSVKKVLLDEIIKNSSMTPEQKEAQKTQAKEEIKQEAINKAKTVIEDKTSETKNKIQSKILEKTNGTQSDFKSILKENLDNAVKTTTGTQQETTNEQTD